jgi:CBS domain containing-hemolysin-like protein
MSDWLAIALTVALLAANGFFVAAEFALVSARRSVVEPQAERGSRSARTALDAMENVSLMMAGAQLGITVCSLALGALSEPVIAHLLRPGFQAVHLPHDLVHPLAFGIALLVITVLHVVLGEMIPKNVALAGPERTALALATPLVAVVKALKPLIWCLNRSANLVLRAVGVHARDEVMSSFTRSEVASMVAESHREGLLDVEEHELLSTAIDFEVRHLGDVVLPTSRLHTVSAQITPDGLEDLAVRTGYSRFPLTDLSGYLHVKDVLTLPERTGAVPRHLVRPLPSVSISATLPAALEMMRAQGVHLLRAVDGRQPVGVVAMEDVLEELIGEVRDVNAPGR